MFDREDDRPTSSTLNLPTGDHSEGDEMSEGDNSDADIDDDEDENSSQGNIDSSISAARARKKKVLIKLFVITKVFPSVPIF